MKEVFISRRLNKWGRRFGFVRFFEVRNVGRMERDLDSLYIGNMKLHVNIPKYRRRTMGVHKGDMRDPRASHSGRKREGVERKEVWVEKKRNLSYAEAVKGKVQQEEWKGTTIEVETHILPWMEKSVVGQLKEGMDFDQLSEDLVKEGLNRLRARKLGDNLILLTPREGEKAKDIIKDNNEWFDNVFTSIKSWMTSCVADHKLMWLRCYGISLPYWNKECFTNVLGESITLVSIDPSTMLWENLEFVRLQVRCRYNHNPGAMKSMQINKQRCCILIEEETPVYYGELNMVKECGYRSSDSVPSSDTYVEETAYSTRSGEEEIQPELREVVRSKREEEVGETAEDGDQSRQKINVHFGKSYLKNLFCQRSGCSFLMNEESLGQRVAQGADLDCDPTKNREYSTNGCVENAELAKTVIEVECYTPVRQNMGHELEAHYHVLRSSNPAQLKEDGSEAGPVQKDCECGEGKEDRLDDITNGEKEGGRADESEGSDNGNPTKVHMLMTTNVVNEALHVGGEEITLVRDNLEEANGKDNTSAPPRRRKLKGLFELGDSISFPRRSVRLISRSANAKVSSSGRDGMCSISVSDGEVVNCNLRFSGPSGKADPSKLWEIGKKAGLKCWGDEEEIVNEYICLEKRDKEVMKKYEKGNKNDNLC